MGQAWIGDIRELRGWVANAQPGEALTYFRGHLAKAADTDRFARCIAEEVVSLQRAGLVAPVQRRHGADDYCYILQRTSNI